MVWLFLWIVACSTPDTDQPQERGIVEVPGLGEHDGNATSPIIGGSAPDAPEHAATVGLNELTDGGTSVYVLPFCTGTLITDTVVLTAAHCLDLEGRINKPNYIPMDPADLAIYVGDDPDADILDHLYLVSDLLILPTYDRRESWGDIALVRLASPVTEAVPVPHLRAVDGFVPADVGLALDFAGFGDDENGDYGVKLHVVGALGSIGCTVTGCRDAGDATTMIAYEQTTAGPCFGDSGGPAFLERLGAVWVGGITSYGDANCTVYGVSTRVDAYQGFIEAFIGGTGPGATVQVTPDAMAGWRIETIQTATGFFGVGPGPSAGDGSMHMLTGSGDGPSQGGKSWLTTSNWTGRRLESVYELSYASSVSSAGSAATHLGPALNLYVDTDGDEDHDAILVYEPYYSTLQGSVTQDTWQSWDARNGVWWTTAPVGDLCAFDCFFTWDDLLAEAPDATLADPDDLGSMTLQAGQFSGGIWAGFEGAVDLFSLDQLRYDFEPAGVAQP